MLEVLIGFSGLVVVHSWVLMMNSLVMYMVYLVFNVIGLDEYNLKIAMVLLSFWLILLLFLVIDSSSKSLDLLIMLISLLFCLCVTFFSGSMIMFYVGFEMSVLPMLLIIYGWGYQPDRLEAGFYMIMYTVVFSLPLLIIIFWVEFKNVEGMVIYFMTMLAFLTKLPMFGFHFWLPRAHVEAPTFGSMILAGLMLKLGGYGIMKVYYLWGDFLYLYSYMIIVLSVIGGVVLSFICFVQSDMKMLIAYSSIVHMSIVLSGILTLSEAGLNGCFYIMIGHGLCSSGLFCVLGLTYNRTHTRSIYLNKGILNIMPTCTLWWFLFCSSNLAFPPCLNLPGEIILFISILSWGKWMYLMLATLGIFSSLYSIYLFAFTQQGVNSLYYSMNNFILKESLLMSMHWIPLNLLILDLSLMSI